MNNVLTQNDSCCATAREEVRRTRAPHYTVKENAENFTVTAYVPGIDRSSLETTVDGDNLIVSGRQSETVSDDWTPLYRETVPTDYRLVLGLDRRVNRDLVQAELSQGVLKLTFPKAEEVKPRRVEIKG